jgi:hypothetical protein
MAVFDRGVLGHWTLITAGVASAGWLKNLAALLPRAAHAWAALANPLHWTEHFLDCFAKLTFKSSMNCPDVTTRSPSCRPLITS